MVRVALLLSAIVGLASGLADTDTITWGGDNSRAGYQTNHNMNPAIVGSSQFDQVFRTQLPGRYNGSPESIFSQPLVYTPNGDTRQYVYFATTQNNVYKLDAKTGEIVESRNLHIPFLTDDLDGCVDINPTVGIISTGVIDPETETLYLTAKTYVNQEGGNGPQGRPAGRYYIHALDVNDLSERENYPIDLEGITARNNPTRMFNGGIHLQRPALLHQGQYIYAGFGSHCVQYNFTGWVIGWDKTTGSLVEQFATQGEGVPNDVKGAAIWMSGGGLASDDAGSIFYATGNGYASQLSTIPVNGFNPPTALEEAAVHMTINEDGSLNLVDFFMPHEKQALDGADKDLGTSPLEILPSEFSCGDITRIGVVTGKSGKTYWLNLDNLGGYRNGPNNLDNVIQVYENENSVYAGAGVYPLEGGYIYINVIQYPTHVFKFSCTNGVPSFAKVADSPADNAYILGVSHGTVTSLNGEPGTGLLWTTDVQGEHLKVYDAVPVDGLLNQIKSFQVPGTTKFTRAVFGDGMMYMGTTLGYVYGFGSPNTTPLNCTEDVNFGTVDISEESAERPITCVALAGLTVDAVALDDEAHYSLSGLPTLPLQLAEGDDFSVNAKFHPARVGLLSESIVIDTTNGVEGFSTSTSVRLTGTGASAGPLLSVNPTSVSFQNIVTGSAPSTANVLLSNDGSSALAVTTVQYSEESIDGPFETWSGSGPLVVGLFTVSNIPSTIAADTALNLGIQFNPSSNGNFTGFVKFTTDGGEGTISLRGVAGPAPVARVEFQTPDAQDWVPYSADEPFDFGNVTQNTARSLRFRVTNDAAAGGVRLSLTVSKPPFGIASIIRAANSVDLGEGTSLAPGQSASAVLTCSVPKSQWNVEPYDGSATWTMNTNDPNFEKHVFEWICKAVSEQAPPLLGDGLGQYQYIGCFKENNPDRQLDQQLYGNDASTNAMCIERCASGDWIFCGTQYHRECWGGNTIPNLRVEDGNCNFDCAGDLNQICGGNGINGGGAYFSLFADTLQWDGNTTIPNPPDDPDDPDEPTEPPGGPVVNPGVAGYVSIGCYTEATTGRALPFGKNLERTTVATCVAACAADDYSLAGLEYSSECWCGNVFGTGAVPAPDEDCDLTCRGNATEFCGGPSRLNVYQLQEDALPTSSSVVSSSTASSSASSSSASFPVTTTSVTTTTTPTPTPTGPAVRETVGDWEFQGCWTETNNGRALPDDTFADDDMTLEACGDFCMGYSFFGVEYGRECYCGDAVKAESSEVQDGCTFLCPGDASTFCGGSMRLQMYKYNDPVAITSEPVRSLPGASSSVSTSLSSSSVASSTLSSASSTVSTTSESTSLTSVSASVASSSSSSISSASSSSIATSESVEPTTTSTSVVSSSSTSTSSSASPTQTAPYVYPGNTNFTYYSCVSEPSSGRLMDDQIFNNGDNMTIKACLERCWDFDWAGVEYGRECWCGDRLNLSGNTGATPGRNMTDEDCTFRCPGDKDVFCGDHSKMSLYVKKDRDLD